MRAASISLILPTINEDLHLARRQLRVFGAIVLTLES